MEDTYEEIGLDEEGIIQTMVLQRNCRTANKLLLSSYCNVIVCYNPQRIANRPSSYFRRSTARCSGSPSIFKHLSSTETIAYVSC